MSARSPRRSARTRLQVFRVVVLVLTGAFFVIPLLSMLDFSTRVFNGGGRTGAAWALLVTDPLLTSLPAERRGTLLAVADARVLPGLGQTATIAFSDLNEDLYSGALDLAYRFVVRDGLIEQVGT